MAKNLFDDTIPDRLPQRNLFDDVVPEEKPRKSLGVGAFLRKAKGNIIPSLAAAGAGAGGFAAGAALAPATGGMSLVIPLATSLAGGFLGATGARKAQDFAFERIDPEGYKKSKFQDARDVREHPVASLAGELAPGLLTFKPSVSTLKTAFLGGKKAITQGTKFLTPVERSAITNVGAGAGIGGGVEAGQQVATGEFDPARLALATAAGAVTNRPTKLGKKLGYKEPALAEMQVSKKELPELSKRYVERFGRFVSADDAKELFRDQGYSGLNANQYHEASSQVAKRAYSDLLKSKAGTGNKTVLFTAGGPGVGKTTGLKALGDAVKDYPVIYDSNLSGLSSSSAKIQQALDSGYGVEILYFHREPVEAFAEGVVPRALRTGRVVNIKEVARRFQESPETFGKLMEEFGGDERVRFSAFETATGKAARKLEPSAVKELWYNSVESEKRFSDELAKREKEGAIDQRFSERFREGLAGSDGEGGAGRPGGPVHKDDPGSQAEGQAPESVGSKFIETVKKSPRTSKELSENAEALYGPVTNRQSLAQARALIAKDPEYASAVARNPDDKSALSTAVSVALMDDAQKAGRFQEAIDVAEVAAKKLSEAGQFVQAAAIYGRLTPEGALAYAQREVGRYNAKSGRGIQITPVQAAVIRDLAEKARSAPEGRGKAIASAKLLDGISRLVPPSWGQKLAHAQTLAMLLNPKTAIRNVLGNLGFAMAENASDAVGAVLDVPLSVLTGKRSKVMPSFGAQAKGGAEGFRLGVEDALNNVDTHLGMTQFDLPKTPAFRGKVGGSLNRLLSYELKVPDRVFFHAAYEGSLVNQMKAAGVAQPTEAMREVAVKDGLFRTFQDRNPLSEGLSGVKKSLNKLSSYATGTRDFGLGDIVLKFPKTPANILARGIDYSPAGFIGSLKKLADPLFSKPFDQKGFVEATSRALIGSAGLIGVGLKLRDLGIITGRVEKDRDLRAVQREAGLGSYKFNVSALKRYVLSGFDKDETKLTEGDSLWSYDWFQPSAIGIALGANVSDGLKGKGGGAAGIIAGSIEEAANTLAEQPLLTGFTRLFKKQPAQGVMDALQGIPATFVPTVFNQVRQLLDNSAVESYDPNYWAEAFNLVKARIPGASGTLPRRVTPFGKTQETYQGGSNNPLNVFLNPAFVTKYAPSDEALMVLSIAESTGETQQAPKVAPRSLKINGQQVQLSANQMEEFGRYTGETSRLIFGGFSRDSEFQKLSDEAKARILGGVLSDIGTAAKIELLGHSPKKVDSGVLKVFQFRAASKSTRGVKK